MLSVIQEGTKYHFWVFGMSRPEIESRSIYFMYKQKYIPDKKIQKSKKKNVDKKREYTILKFFFYRI